MGLYLCHIMWRIKYQWHFFRRVWLSIVKLGHEEMSPQSGIAPTVNMVFRREIWNLIDKSAICNCQNHRIIRAWHCTPPAARRTPSPRHRTKHVTTNSKMAVKARHCHHYVIGKTLHCQILAFPACRQFPGHKLCLSCHAARQKTCRRHHASPASAG